MKTKELLAVAGLALAAATISIPTQAAYIGTFDGNDCVGVFAASSGGFATCAIPDTYQGYDLNPSPVIAKYDVDDNKWEINTALFPTIDGSEFTLAKILTGYGTWMYDPGDGDPVITYFVAKGGNGFNLFSNDGDPNGDTWWTPTNPNNYKAYGLSHITFYDGGAPPSSVPEPATLGMLGLGMIGLAAIRRRKDRKA